MSPCSTAATAASRFFSASSYSMTIRRLGEASKMRSMVAIDTVWFMIREPLLEEPQERLWQLVRLREHGDAGLQQNLAAGEGGHFRRDIEVHQVRSGGFGVLDRGRDI